VLLIGFEVIIQVPLAQPTNFQYIKPAIDPKMIPIMLNLFFKTHLGINYSYLILPINTFQGPPLYTSTPAPFNILLAMPLLAPLLQTVIIGLL